jgi:DNA-binding NtrC family response regulator
MVCELDRLCSHTSSDDHRVYRPQDEIDAMADRDPIIVLANESSANQAVESMGDGATDYLLKPINTTELSAKLNRAINERKLTEEVIALQQEKRNCQQSSTGSDEVKTLQSLERDAILKALDRFNGVRGKTAKALGISVRTLQRKIKEYGYNGNK